MKYQFQVSDEGNVCTNLYTVQGGFNTVIEASIGRDVWFVLMKVGSPPSSLILTNLRPKPDNAH